MRPQLILLLCILFPTVGIGAYELGLHYDPLDKTGTLLARAKVHRGHLRGAHLRGAHLRSARLQGEDLSGADLRGADLRGASLEGAHLTGADLTGARLCGANLKRTQLLRAKVENADLRNANLSGSTLDKANLKGALLGGADLRDAAMGHDRTYAGHPAEPPNVSQAKYDASTLWPRGFDPVRNGAIRTEPMHAKSPAASLPTTAAAILGVGSTAGNR